MSSYSYIVFVGSNKELIVRARSANRANEKIELRLLRKGDRQNPVLSHLTRRATEEEIEDLMDEIGGEYAW